MSEIFQSSDLQRDLKGHLDKLGNILSPTEFETYKNNLKLISTLDDQIQKALDEGDLPRLNELQKMRDGYSAKNSSYEMMLTTHENLKQMSEALASGQSMLNAMAKSLGL